MSVLPRLFASADASPGDRVVIEPMRRRHLREVVPLEAVAYPTSWSRAVFEGELAQVKAGSRCYLVARVERRVVGYAGLWFVADPGGDQAHVTNVVVDPRHRRTGIATRLLTALADEAIGRGCVAWTLEVRASSEGAHALYRRFGFAPAGVRKRYYDNAEDAIVMWCHDIHTPEYAARLAALRGAGAT
ncbi:MAG TPA: ribosomal protein S18-alanine N-acetyltransferase [Ilumatobacter sp.]